MPKQIKLMILVVVGIFGLGALLFLNQPKEHEQMKDIAEEHNILQADKLIHDFGTISMKNGNVKTVFKVKNTTAEAMVLSKLYTTCMCTEAKLAINGRSLGPFGMPGHGAIATFMERIG